MRDTEKDNWRESPQIQQESKPFQELNLMDDYLFDVVTMDIETCKDIVELSMNIKIRNIRWKEGQKVIHNLPGKRGIRLDFYVEDIDDNLYNVEMQMKKVGNLPKRTRFYKALMDSPLLKSGEKGFDNLPPTYIIFICGFDLFGCDKYRYTFKNTCQEILELVLKDECTTIFLNTKGKNKEEVEPALVDFLKLVENSTEEVAEEAKDERVRRIYKKIKDLKKRADLEADYMKMEERDRLMREEAEMRGEIRGEIRGKKLGEYNKLKSLVSKKRSKSYTAEQIAEILEEDIDTIEKIIQELEKDSIG